jgi:hypothetical protein
MPFPENPGLIAVLCKNLRHRLNIPAHDISAGWDHTGFVVHGIQTGHQLSSGGSTNRGYMEIAKPDTFSIQFIKKRCFQNRIAMTRKIGISLIVRQYDNDIGANFYCSGIKADSQQEGGTNATCTYQAF